MNCGRGEDKALVGGGAVDWNECYATGNAPWDMGHASPPLVALARGGALPTGRRVLVPGCGTGQEVRFLAELDYVVLGADIAPLAVLRAQELVAGRPNAAILCIDLLDPATQVGVTPVDWAFDQTFFCALPPERRDEWAAALRRWIVPAGELLALAFRTENQDRPPYDSPPDVMLTILQKAGFEQLEVRPLDAESHPARRGRETLVRVRRGS